MAVSVSQDRGLTEPMPSMADQTDVGMEREVAGPMMSTGFMVWECALWFSCFVQLGWYTCAMWL